MSIRSVISILVVLLVSLLTGCASIPEGDRHAQFKDSSYYAKTSNHAAIVKRAEQNDIVAMLELGYLYGGGEFQNNALANKWLERAASLDDMSANAIVGVRHIFYEKSGYPKNDALAISYINRAYELYLMKPEIAWTLFEKHRLAGAFFWRASIDKDNINISDYCMVIKIEPTHPFVYKDLRKLGKTCK